MPFVKANDINLHYEEHGDGTPLVLITGFNQNSLSYASFVEPLAKHFRLILFDNRASGQSDVPDTPCSLKAFVEDTIGLLDAFNIESAHFLGTSMGALITQKLCIDHPDRIIKAVLCAPFAKLPNIAVHNIRCQLKLYSKGVSFQDLMELNAAWLLSNEFLNSPDNVKKFLKDLATNPYPSSPQGTLSQAQALMEADIRSEIKNIPHEILLLVGEHDIDTPVYCAEYIKQHVPNCEMHVFKEMGHMFNYENPGATCKKALEFLKK